MKLSASHRIMEIVFWFRTGRVVLCTGETLFVFARLPSGAGRILQMKHASLLSFDVGTIVNTTFVNEMNRVLTMRCTT
jgi:hypothetical protein